MNIPIDDLERYHAAAKLIESDGFEGYYACRQRFGSEIANVLLVAHLRRENGSMTSWPAPPEARGKTDEFLKNAGLLGG